MRAAFVTANGTNSHFQQTIWQISVPACDDLSSRHSHSNENETRKGDDHSLPRLTAACSNQSTLLPQRLLHPISISTHCVRVPASKQQSSQLAPNMLEHLPAEIRNEIYHYALISEGIIAISRRRGKITAKSQHFTTGGTDTTTGQLALPLLRVNTISKREAAPIIYGNNTFLFSNSDHFADWMRLIHGKNARAVRLVRLQYVSMCHDFFLKPLIAHIPTIARLEIPHNKHCSAQRLAGDLKNFVRRLCEYGGKGREVEDVLDALVIYSSSRTARAALQEIGGEAEAYECDVKVELMKLLS
ncbi:hypothetical protein CBER1_04254 [Cercospora berteroae]|uniref:F-box domain-containing protein n=1 Tax=Cercospora berteroae TaxID=357750 RepID=A0A2S6CHS3_9PEZI|nr:hypothetical protein CBER1_04254 [Cercospora berteroae]